MIEIQDILIRGFMAFGGSYDTFIRLDNLGSCLITGQVLGIENEPGDDNSNGAAKSTAVNAILWCLSGRTMHNPNPGDKIITYGEKSCLVRLNFKNGDSLTRTRNGTDGHDEILYYREGQDVSLGTNIMQQAELNRLLGFDYTIFCGSVFFTQYAKSWMEMSDPKRKQALEREFRLDRIQLRADYAKEKYQTYETKQEQYRLTITTTQQTIETLKTELEEMVKSSENFETDKTAHIKELNSQKVKAEADRDLIIIPNIAELKTKWEIINKALTVLNRKSEIIDGLQAQHRGLTADIRVANSTINTWSNKTGKLCSECARPFDDQYIKSKTSTPEELIKKSQAKLELLANQIASETTKLTEARTKIEAKQPTQSVSEAEREQKEWARRNQTVKNVEIQIAKAQQAENKFGLSIDRINKKISSLQAVVDDNLVSIKEIDHLMLHWNYVYKTYNDRRKIKGRILKEYIPYLNERVNYYLDRFGMKLRIEFTDGMGVRSNYWGYEFFCGGERKRVDVSIMLAMFDLHTLMYGCQCNVVVLDEVDGRLDKRGARLLVDIVKSDIATKVDSVLVISHRLDMRGAFASELKIQKDSPDPDGRSRVLEVLT